MSSHRYFCFLRLQASWRLTGRCMSRCVTSSSHGSPRASPRKRACLNAMKWAATARYISYHNNLGRRVVCFEFPDLCVYLFMYIICLPGPQITRCTSIPCVISSPTECLWMDWVMENTVYGQQAKFFACIKRNDDSCAWYRGTTPPKKDFMDIEDP